MKNFKGISVLLLIMAMLCLTGCWNYRELDTLSMVSGFSIDKGELGHKYHLTFELLNLSEDKIAPKLLESDGDTIFDAVRNATAKTQKKLYFSDCKIVIVNKEIASESLAPVLDWITRDTEPRLTINLLISNGETAAELLVPKPVTNNLQAMEIWRTLQLNSTQLSKTMDVRLFEAVNMLAGEGTSLTLPTIKVTETKNGGQGTVLDGTAVFKKDRLVGFLDTSETKSLLFIKDKITDGLLLANLNSTKGQIALEILSNQTKITPVISNGTITMQIDIKNEAALSNNETGINYITEIGLREVENAAETGLKKNISDLIKKVQNEYGSDIFGFGDSVNRSDPGWWKKNKTSWDKTFSTLKYNISVKVDIRNTSITDTIIKVGD